MDSRDWKILTTVHDTLSAQVLLDRLRGEGVTVRLRTDTAILGEARRCDVLVLKTMAHRAQAVLDQPCFTDEELTELALRETPENPDF